MKLSSVLLFSGAIVMGGKLDSPFRPIPYHPHPQESISENLQHHLGLIYNRLIQLPSSQCLSPAEWKRRSFQFIIRSLLPVEEHFAKDQEGTLEWSALMHQLKPILVLTGSDAFFHAILQMNVSLGEVLEALSQSHLQEQVAECIANGQVEDAVATVEKAIARGPLCDTFREPPILQED